MSKERMIFMKLNGLSTDEAEKSRLEHGSNDLTQIPPEPLWKKFLKGFADPMIIILLAALAIQAVLFFMGKADWYEPVGVLVAILIANGVSSISQHKQEGKASALKAEEEAKETAKVMRDGQLKEIHIGELVVGDIVYLQSGDKIAADGEMVEGCIKVDQAALNGETEEAEKMSSDGSEYDIKDLLNKNYVYRGTVVCSEEGYMQVKVVGDKTMFGQLALEVQEETRATPLQMKLAKLAKQISVFGYVGAALIIVAVIAKTIILGQSPADVWGWVQLLINAVTVAITVIVCAVPEGLPMLTSVLLSFQSIKMAKDNVLVRNINGLETAGSLSILFTDKTGTITEGKLSVTEVTTGNVRSFNSLEEIPSKLRLDILTGIGVNNSSTVSDGSVIGGNSTDRALMAFIDKDQYYDKLPKEDVKDFNPFDSSKKYSSLTVKRESGSVTYIKGAPERILIRCKKYLDEHGKEKELVEKNYLTTYVNGQAAKSMRLLAVAKADGEDGDGDLTLICILSIRDNVRKEAADAIREVKSAGIQVVMITGDRKETAVAIAKDAGLLTSHDEVALTSAELGELSDDEVKEVLPKLRVVARALPTDKSRLVRIAQEMDQVVGMTGDGVNDSPALKKADVGFAMGSGTEVAKAAGDITILDDNFLSIKKAILYGRTMFKTIRKFLVFQLTVNVAAVLICFLGPILDVNNIYGNVLTVVQLLVINLAMDTLAAIAFGSEPPMEEYMKERPVPRQASIVNKAMLTEIIITALYITAACLAILFVPDITNLFIDPARDIKMAADNAVYLKSALFAAFMMSIAFNGLNARTESLNLFKGLKENRSFILVMAGILILQFVFVTFGGDFLSVKPLDAKAWAMCFIAAVLVLPIDLIRKMIVMLTKKN